MSSRRVCAVTGGSRGIGLAVVRAFAASGCDVSLCGRDPERLDAAVRELSDEFPVEIRGMTADLSQPGSAKRFVAETAARLGRLDVLVNNAGQAPHASIVALSEASITSALAVNNAALVESTRAAWPRLTERGGVLINISSLAAVDPFPGFSVYSATKAFVEAFTRAVANEGRAAGVRAFCVRPGAVDTPLLRSLFPDFPADERLRPEDVAELILTLCTDSMQYSSGQTITIRK